MTTWLPASARLLAVCAHPDDESFGLGAILAALHEVGTSIDVLCFTRGEASTLGAVDNLSEVRAEEFAAASEVLGVDRAELLCYPDGALSDVPIVHLAGHVSQLVRRTNPDSLLVFDEGGVTGHPDHRRATAAALAAADRLDLAVVAWAIPNSAAEALNAEFGTAFVGRVPGEIDIVVPVEREAQLKAIACHASQSKSNGVLWRRLELLGEREHLRYLRRTDKPLVATAHLVTE